MNYRIIFYQVLKTASLTVISNSECREKFEEAFNKVVKETNPNAAHIYYPMYPWIICVSGRLTNSSTCRVDSGGDLNNWKLLTTPKTDYCS